MSQNSLMLNLVESITNLPITGQDLGPGSSPSFINLALAGNLSVAGTSTFGGLVTANTIQTTTISADTASAQTLVSGGDTNVGGQLFVSGDITSSQNINNTDTVSSKYMHVLADHTVDGAIQCKELHCDDVITADTQVNSTTLHASNFILSDNLTQTTTLQVGTILGLSSVIPVNGVPMQMNGGLRLPGLATVNTNTDLLSVNSGTNAVEKRTYASINPLTTKGDLMSMNATPAPTRLAVSATNGAILSADSTTTTGLAWDTKETLSLYRLTITLPMVTINSGSSGNSAAVTMATGEAHTVQVVTCIRNSVTFAQGFITATLRFKNVGGTVTFVGSSGISAANEGGVNGSTWITQVSGATYFFLYTAGGGNPINFSSTLYITRCI